MANVEIKIYLCHMRILPTHLATHIKALITNLKDKRFITIEFDHDSEGNFNIESHSAPEQITLHSDEDYDAFVLNCYHKFGMPQTYRFFWNNCADAVNYVLNYFFPHHDAINAAYYGTKTLFGLTTVGLLGLRFLPAPVGISTPTEVFLKARIIKKYYKPREHSATEIKNNSNYLCRNTLQREQNPANRFKTPLITALNYSHDPKVIKHFIYKHLPSYDLTQAAYAALFCIANNKLDFLRDILISNNGLADKINFDEVQLQGNNNTPSVAKLTNRLLRLDLALEQIEDLFATAINNKVDLVIKQTFCLYLSRHPDLKSNQYFLRVLKYNFNFVIFLLDANRNFFNSQDLDRFFFEAIKNHWQNDSSALAKKIVALNLDLPLTYGDENYPNAFYLLIGNYSNLNWDVGRLVYDLIKRPSESVARLNGDDSVLSFAVSEDHFVAASLLLTYHANKFPDKHVSEARKYLGRSESIANDERPSLKIN